MHNRTDAPTGVPAAADQVAGQLAGLAAPERMLEQIFLGAPVGMQLFARDGRCLLVNPMHTRLFGAVPPPDYNIFEDTILQATGMAALVRRAFAGERISIPTIWYDARELANVQVTQGRRFAVGAELVPLRTDGDAVSHVLFVFNDVTEAQLAREEAEAAAARSAFLADAGRLLSSTLDLQQTLSGLARLAASTLGDFCVVDLVDADGTMRRVAGVHADPARQPLVDELLRYPRCPARRSPPGASSRAAVPSCWRKWTPKWSRRTRAARSTAP